MYEKRVYRATIYFESKVIGRIKIAADDKKAAIRAGRVWGSKHYKMDSEIDVLVRPTSEFIWIP